MDKEGIYLNQFWLSNLMVSFVFAYDPPKLQKNRIKNDVINGYDFGDKTLHLGVQNSAIDLTFCTLVDD